MQECRSNHGVIPSNSEYMYLDTLRYAVKPPRKGQFVGAT